MYSICGICGINKGCLLLGSNRSRPLKCLRQAIVEQYIAMHSSPGLYLIIKKLCDIGTSEVSCICNCKHFEFFLIIR